MRDGKSIVCWACDGHGIIDAGYHNPDECGQCNGSGANWQYTGGAVAKYYSGPLIGRFRATALEAKERT